MNASSPARTGRAVGAAHGTSEPPCILLILSLRCPASALPSSAPARGFFPPEPGGCPRPWRPATIHSSRPSRPPAALPRVRELRRAGRGHPDLAEMRATLSGSPPCGTGRPADMAGSGSRRYRRRGPHRAPGATHSLAHLGLRPPRPRRASAPAASPPQRGASASRYTRRSHCMTLMATAQSRTSAQGHVAPPCPPCAVDGRYAPACVAGRKSRRPVPHV